jgi:hypothetical protein
VGACQEGERACKTDGSGFGECQGDTLPAAEDCTLPPDEDCDGFACSRLAWHRVVETDDQDLSGYDVVLAVDVHDESGDVLVAGDFPANLALAPEKVQADGVGDLFIARLDAQGQTQWLKALKGPGRQMLLDMSVTADGGIVMAAATPQPITVEGESIAPGMFLLKLAPDGSVQWVLECAGSADISMAVRLAVAGNGQLAVYGRMTSATLSPACKGLSEPSDTMLFAGLIDTDGSAVWMRKLGSAQLGDVAADASGNVIISGTGDDGYTIDSFSLSDSQGNGQGFVAKLAQTDGKLSWGVSIGANGRETLPGLEVATAGEVYAIGAHSAAFSLQGTDVTHDGMIGSDYFALKLDAAGSVVWARRIGDASSDPVLTLSVSAGIRIGRNQDLVVAGTFEGSALPPTQATSVGASKDIFVGAIDEANGTPIWARVFASPDMQWFRSLAVRDTGVIHVGATVEKAVSYGGKDISAVEPEGDYFVAQIEP